MLSIDVGTTNLKGVYYDENENIVDIKNLPLKDLKSDQIIYERNPDEILNLIEELITADTTEVVLTVPMHTLILLDQNGERLTGLVTWNDKRGHQNIQKLSSIQSHARYMKTGTPIHSMNPAIKLTQLLEDFPQTAYVSTLKDWLFYQLTGEWVIDRPSASATGLYSLHEKNWDEYIINNFNLSIDQFPRVQEVTYQAPLITQKKTKVYLGATDGVSSSYSVSRLTPVLSLGTSHAVRAVVDKVILDGEKMPFSYHIRDDEYLVGFPSNNGGNAIRWLVDTFNSSYDELNEIIASKHGQKPRITFIPYLNGERAPLWNDNAEAEFIQLNRNIDRAEILYSGVCGVFFNIKTNVENLKKYHRFSELTVSGGLSRSESMMQLLADILELTLRIPVNDHSEGYGALRLINPKANKELVYNDVMVEKPNYLESYNEFIQEVNLRYEKELK